LDAHELAEAVKLESEDVAERSSGRRDVELVLTCSCGLGGALLELEAFEYCREVDEGLGGIGGGVLRLADMVGDDARTGANARGTVLAIRFGHRRTNVVRAAQVGRTRLRVYIGIGYLSVRWRCLQLRDRTNSG
jgi:hypothetical protein